MSATWDETFDVVVVGSGAAGFTAAVTAAPQGASVVVLEKAATTGGTTRKAAAWFWILNNRFMREAGIEDPREDALRYLARLSRPAEYTPSDRYLGLPEHEYRALETFYDFGDEAIAALEELGALQAAAGLDVPDYSAQLKENVPKHGRTLWPAPAGGGQGGEAMIERFREAAERLGVEVRTSTPVTDLILDGGRVAGVVATGDAGGRVRARRGVVFASGGFTHNPALRRAFLRGPYVGGCAALTNTGDFIPLAQAAGAELGNMQQAWSAPIVIERMLRDPAKVAGSFVLPGTGMIIVNRDGRRVINEKAVYNEFTRTFFDWDSRTLSYPNLPLILIWDQQVAEGVAGNDFGNPVPPADVDGYWVLRAGTLAELTDLIAKRLTGVELPPDHDTLAADFTENVRQSVAATTNWPNPASTRTSTEARPPSSGSGGDIRPRGRREPDHESVAPAGPYYATILAPARWTLKAARASTRTDGSCDPTASRSTVSTEQATARLTVG